MIYYLIIVSIIMVIYVFMALNFKISHSKILVFNQITSLLTLFIAMLSSYEYYRTYIDIAIIYSLLSFITMKALLHFGSSDK